MKTGLHAAAYITLAVSLALLSTSCGFGNSGSNDAQQTDRGAYIQIRVPFAAAAEAERTAVPSSSGDSFPVKSYVITASKSGQTDVSATLTDFSIKQKLSLKSEGSWTVTVNGYASDNGTGNAICTGSGTISVSAAPYYDGYASVTVYPSGTGTGTISLAVSVPATVKGAKVTLTGPGTDTTAKTYTALYTTNEKTFTISSLTADGASGSTTAFTAGAYTMTVQLYNSSTVTDSSTLIYRRTEVVAVWQGFTTDRWINAYALESENSSAAAYSTTLAVTADDLADTVTTWQTLTIKSESAEKGTYTSNALPPYIMNTDETAELVLTVNKNQTAYVKVDGKQPVYTVSMTVSAYTLTYTLPTPSSCTDNTVTVTVFASNGVLFGSYNITYGALYVNETVGRDSANTGSKAYPYKTIAKAVSMLPSSSDTNNKIILQSDITTNTEDTASTPANGYAADSSLVSFNYATAEKPLVLTIDGGGYAIDAGGSSNNRRVMYVGSSVELTLQNVTLTGGYMSGSGTEGSGGGVYLNGGTLNLLSGAKIGYTAGTEAATSSRCSNYASVNGGGIYMAADSGAVVNMYDGAYISYNYGGSNGGGVYMAGESTPTKINTFNMYGGTISCNGTAAAGGGLSVNYGIFKMLDDMNTSPSIKYNKAAQEGGALHLRYTSKSCMETGEITGNRAGSTSGGGGAIVLFDPSTFTMSGGKISGNSAGMKGGGIYVRYDGNSSHKNYFIMSGGTISGNSVDIVSGSMGNGICDEYSFTLSGNGTIAADNEVYLNSFCGFSPAVTVAADYVLPTDIKYGAVITWCNGNNTLGTKVLAPASGSLSYAQCNMFALTPVTGETGTTSTLYCIAPGSGNGVIAKRQSGTVSTITDISGASVTFGIQPTTGSTSCDYFSRTAEDSNISFTLYAKDAEGNIVAVTDKPSGITGFTATLYYGSSSQLITLGTPTVSDNILTYTLGTEPADDFGAVKMRLMPEGTYRLYLTAVVSADNNKDSSYTYSSWQTLTIK